MIEYEDQSTNLEWNEQFSGEWIEQLPVDFDDDTCVLNSVQCFLYR